jgi:hypothetical protein
MTTLISKLLCVVLLFCYGPTGFTQGASETGDGAFIQGLIEAELADRTALSNEEIERITEQTGYTIRNSLIVPLFKAFFSEAYENLSPELNLIKKRFGTSDAQSEFFIDIEISHILVGDCAETQRTSLNGAEVNDIPTTCTISKPGAAIIIDKSSIARYPYGVSFSELVGMLCHEYLHHFFPEGIPNHDKYPLARYMAKQVRENSFNETKYSIKDIWIVVNVNQTDRFSEERKEWKEKCALSTRTSPDAFCYYLGHRQGAKSWKTTDRVTSQRLSSLNIGSYRTEYRTWFYGYPKSGWSYRYCTLEAHGNDFLVSSEIEFSKSGKNYPNLYSEIICKGKSEF